MGKKIKVGEWQANRERERGGEQTEHTDRQTDKQTDRQTDTDRVRETETEKDAYLHNIKDTWTTKSEAIG